jgi:hypothetical protein
VAQENIVPFSGQAVVNIGLRLEGSPEIIPLTAGEMVVEHSVISSKVNSPTTFDHHMRAKPSAYIDRVLKALMESGTPRVQVKLGVVSGSRQFYLAAQEHLVVNYSAIPAVEGGHTINLHTADRLWELSRADNKVKAHRGPISAIVKAIAAEAKLDSIVEPTQANGGELYIQSHQDDVEFIVNRLIPRAINEHGRGNYHLFIKDNVLHFHSPDYQADIRRLSYFSPSPATMLVLADQSQPAIAHGAAGVVALAYDPYVGDAKTISSDSTRTLNFARVTPLLKSVAGATKPMPYHVGPNRASEIVALAQNAYEMAYSSMMRLELKLQMSPTVQLGDVFEVNISPSGNFTSPWSGAYSVVELVHEISRGSMTTKIQLQRGEMAAVGQSFKGLRGTGFEDVMVRENFADGNPISLATVANSRKTTGEAEKGPGGETFKVIQQA